jgi:hypothetical protein
MTRNTTQRIASIVTATAVLLSVLAAPAAASVAPTAGDGAQQSTTTSLDDAGTDLAVGSVGVGGEQPIFDEEDDGGSVDVSVSGETCYTVIGAAGFSIEVCVSVTSE